MKIDINDHRKIFAFQGEFNNIFPHLKVEFLSKPSKAGSAASKKIMKNSKRLGECRVEHNKGELTLLPSMTVSDLMQTLRDTFGLSVILFRKSGSEWIEIPESGAFSLEEQDKREGNPA